MSNCYTTPILITKTQNNINSNLFRSDFKEVICFTQHGVQCNFICIFESLLQNMNIF